MGGGASRGPKSTRFYLVPDQDEEEKDSRPKEVPDDDDPKPIFVDRFDVFAHLPPATVAPPLLPRLAAKAAPDKATALMAAAGGGAGAKAAPPRAGGLGGKRGLPPDPGPLANFEELVAHGLAHGEVARDLWITEIVQEIPEVPAAPKLPGGVACAYLRRDWPAGGMHENGY
uniref:Uncharacterized protein n=1 Tax=Zooxanthella nutricula TaxID=1333877 RepID=A0A6U6GQA7_9DINO